MAYLARRAGGRFEIREAVTTGAGPRSRTLASFRGAITPELLDRAERRATRPLDRERLLARAAALGVAVAERRADGAARELLEELRRGAALDPALASLLRDALEPPAGAAARSDLAEVGEWIGADDARRGAAMRDLLRLSDTIARSRPRQRSRRRKSFPRFHSRRRRA
jgi:hypothetical protein